MAAETKIQRSKSDLRAALIEQVSLLQAYCEHYDNGELVFSKPMATTLRVLLHHAGQSHSLLQQLGLRSGRYFSVAPPLNPRNLFTECNLVYLQVSGTDSRFLPRLEFLAGEKRRPFPEWWAAPVLKGKGGQTMSRMDIVRAVTDRDGGAHVDPFFSKTYEDFRTGALLGWYLTVEGQERKLVADPQYACIRAIAHEALLSLQKYASWCFRKQYQ